MAVALGGARGFLSKIPVKLCHSDWVRNDILLFLRGGVFFCNGFLRPFPWIYTCCQDKEALEACNVGIKLTLTSLQFACPPLTHMRAYTLARSAHPGTRRCRAKNGALLRLTQCGVAEISCNKNVIGKIPIKMCEERAEWLPATKEWGGKQEEKEGGSRVWWKRNAGARGMREGYFLCWPLATLPLFGEKTKKHFGSFGLLSRSSLFFKSCFHLAHGSAPSNSWVSQTKSYFLIHSLSHIIILLDRVSRFFFQAFFSSTACSVLRVTSQPQWGKGCPARTLKGKSQGCSRSFAHT